MQSNFVNTWTNAVIVAVANSIQSLLNFLPNIFGAIIIFALGWMIAGMVKGLVLRALEVLQVEPFAEKVGLSQALAKVGASITPSELFGEIIKWAIVLVFLNPTVEVLGLSQVTQVLSQVLLYIPNVIVAVFILMFGVIFADLTGQFIKGTAAALGAGTANALEVITRYAIMVFVVLAALSQLGIARQLIATLFTGFVAMLAISGGLAFGLGGKEIAAEILRDLKDSLEREE